MFPTPKIKWNTNQAALERLTNIYIKDTMGNIRDALDKTSSSTANYIKETMIMRGSPTGSVWHQIINDYRGNRFGARVDSGTMVQAVGSEVTQDNNRFIASYGLPLPESGGFEYFMKQEYGFDLTLPSGKVRQVPGMETAERSSKFMETMLRKEMLRRGFLKGEKDWRGAKIIASMQRGNTFEDAWASANVRSPEQTFASREFFKRKAERDLAREVALQARLDSFKNELIKLGRYEGYVKRFGF